MEAMLPRYLVFSRSLHTHVALNPSCSVCVEECSPISALNDGKHALGSLNCSENRTKTIPRR
jgi:hypothetical protein